MSAPLSERGYRSVRASPEEIAAYLRSHPGYRYPAVDRVECIATGRRIWASGLGIGSHERACPATHTRGSGRTP